MQKDHWVKMLLVPILLSEWQYGRQNMLGWCFMYCKQQLSSYNGVPRSMCSQIHRLSLLAVPVPW